MVKKIKAVVKSEEEAFTITPDEMKHVLTLRKQKEAELERIKKEKEIKKLEAKKEKEALEQFKKNPFDIEDLSDFWTKKLKDWFYKDEQLPQALVDGNGKLLNDHLEFKDESLNVEISISKNDSSFSRDYKVLTISIYSLDGQDTNINENTISFSSNLSKMLDEKNILYRVWDDDGSAGMQFLGFKYDDFEYLLEFISESFKESSDQIQEDAQEKADVW